MKLSRLKELLLYDPESGVFTRRLSKGGYVEGSVAGTKSSYYGYVHITVDRKTYKAHRLAFFYMTGEWPREEVDHINGNRSDNSWRNLRQSSRKENARNCSLRTDNTSGEVGVGYHKKRKQWRARLGKRHLGWFSSKEEAVLARKAALVGEGFSDRHGKEGLRYNNSFEAT